MTLSTTANKVSFAGDGTTVSFAIPFLFIENAHIEAVLRDAAGIETTWVLNTQYTLTGAGLAAGGTLVVSVDPEDYTPAVGETLVIRRVVPETQETDYPEGGAFPAAAHEQALDKLTMLVQQHSEEIARGLKIPVTDEGIDTTLQSVANRANKVLTFDEDGDFALLTPTDDSTNTATASGATSALAHAARFAEAYSVSDFGAIGDGSTDDTAAINAALAAAAGNSVFFPKTANEYLISGKLVLPSNIRISSDGATIKADAGAFTMMEADTKTDILIEGLVFDGDYPTRSGGSGVILDLIDVSRVRVRGCRFVDAPNTAIGITRGDYIWIENNVMSVQYQSGVRLNDPGASSYNEYVWIHANHITGSNDAEAGGHGSICSAGSTDTDGQRHIWIADNYCESDGIALALDTFNFSVCRGNTVRKSNTGGECIALSGDNYQIVGNTVSGSSAAGILLFGTADFENENIIVQGNTCFDNAQGIAMVFSENSTTFRNVLVTGNRCYNTASGTTQVYGIQSYLNAGGITPYTYENVKVVSNHFADNGTAATNLLPGSDGSVIVTFLNDDGSANFGVDRGIDVVASFNSLQAVECVSNGNYISIIRNAAEVGRFQKSGFRLGGADVRFSDQEPLTSYGAEAVFQNDGGAAVRVERLTSDGVLQEFYRDGGLVGTISVSSGTVTYGAAAWAHWGQFAHNEKPSIPVGTVLSTIDEMTVWCEKVPVEDKDGNVSLQPGAPEDEYTDDRLPKVKISDTEGDARVYGVFGNYDADGDINLISGGAFFVRVSGDFEAGDLLESAGDGTAKTQADDVIRSKTIGKVIGPVAETYSDGTHRVPATLYCG